MPMLTDFVPAEFDATQWDRIEPLLKALLDRPVGSPKAFEKWLIDRSELEAACAEGEAVLYIAMTCHTEDAAAQQAYTSYIETVPPLLKPMVFELDKRQAALALKFPLDPQGGRYAVLNRDTAAEVEIFRDVNVPIQTELEKLSQQYQQLIGAMMVSYDGREQTLPMMARYQESVDRSVRETAWRLVTERRLQETDAVDAIFDRMIGLRHTMALNAGFKDFIGYAFKAKKRFDYSPADCRTFHEAAEQVVVPFMRRLDERRRSRLGVDALRPWDLGVDPKGRPPLKPFDGGVDLMRKSIGAFNRLDPRLGRMLAGMGDGSNANGAANGACLDLDSRKGKAPGGYQSMRDRSRKAFIFMNAAGLHRDVETMVHEAGHAFHSMLCVDEPLVRYRSAPLEFCEVASMSMELLTMPYWGRGGGHGPAGQPRGANGAVDCFYPDEEDLGRARRKRIEEACTILPWIATIDAFQHWLYADPEQTREQRTAEWLRLDERFGHAVSWEGLESARGAQWQRQMHLFGAPFYYIEYGIAQLGALQLWLKSLESGEKAAIDAYFKGLSLGGSRPLPDLFRATGLRFDFGPDMVKRLVDRVERELQKLPE